MNQLSIPSPEQNTHKEIRKAARALNEAIKTCVECNRFIDDPEELTFQAGKNGEDDPVHSYCKDYDNADDLHESLFDEDL